jgi:hypothetical protein
MVARVAFQKMREQKIYMALWHDERPTKNPGKPGFFLNFFVAEL